VRLLLPVATCESRCCQAQGCSQQQHLPAVWGGYTAQPWNSGPLFLFAGGVAVLALYAPTGSFQNEW
jgi:hypothetical protein